MDADRNSPLWQVTGQVPDHGLSSDGQFVAGITVKFKTRSGAVGSVFIPQNEYTVDRARALVTARAEAMETVHNMTA